MVISPVQKIEIGSSTIVRTIVFVLALWFLYIAWQVVVMLFAAVIIASAMEPIANWLGRYKVPRALTVIGVYVAILLVGSTVAGLMISPLALQLEQLAQALPGVVDAALVFLPTLHIDETAVVAAFQDGLAKFGNDIANIGHNVFVGTRTVISGIITVVFVFVIALYLVVEQDALKKFAQLITPREHFSYVENVVARAQRGLGRWLLGQLVLGIIVGTIIGVGLYALGVPYALLLGILAGLMEFIPVAGPIIAATPGVIVALAHSLSLGLIVWVFYVVVGQIESHVLIPNIMRRALGLRPLVTIIAVLIGAQLGGLVGVLLAVPAASVVNTIALDIFRRDEIAD